MAVGRFEVGDDVPQGSGSDADLTARFEHGVEVRFLQPEMGDAEVRAVIPARPNRIGLREQVPAGAVGVDQVDDPEFLGAHGRAGSALGTRFEGVFTVDALGKVETEKEVPPGRVDRVRIGEELPIQRLDGGRLGVAQVGMEVH